MGSRAHAIDLGDLDQDRLGIMPVPPPGHEDPSPPSCGVKL